METTRLLVSFGASLETKARNGCSVISCGSAAHQPELREILEEERRLRQAPPPQFQSEVKPGTVLLGSFKKRKFVDWAYRGEELEDNPVMTRQAVEVAGEATFFFCFRQPPESCAKRLRRLETWPFRDVLHSFLIWPEVGKFARAGLAV